MPRAPIPPTTATARTFFTGNTTAVIRPQLFEAQRKLIEWARKELPVSVAIAVECNVKGQIKGFGGATTDEVRRLKARAQELGVKLSES